VDRTPAQPPRSTHRRFAVGHARTWRGRAFAAGGIAAALLLVLVLVGWLVRTPVPTSATLSSPALRTVVGAHAARRAPEPDVRGMDSSRCDR
jgi:hypothetical protein